MTKIIKFLKNTGIVIFIAFLLYIAYKLLINWFDIMIEWFRTLLLKIPFLEFMATTNGTYVLLLVIGIIFLVFGIGIGFWKLIKKIIKRFD